MRDESFSGQSRKTGCFSRSASGKRNTGRKRNSGNSKFRLRADFCYNFLMQLLKSLELIGFKSFAQKTALDFPGGITAIVGPNGSGKSNVIDAVRWILGEREAKNLRGGKAEDLIFAGTPKRPRMGMGQVTIVFDNTSGFFPVDFSEVEITRRIDRSGESEYFLNKE